MIRSLAAISVLVLGCSKAREPAPSTVQVPADAALVATVSIDRLRAGPQWPKLEAALATRLPLADVAKTCPNDPVRSIQSVTLAVFADLAPERAVVIVRGVPRDVADSCAKSFAAAQNHMITVSEDGGFAAYREGEEAVFVSWLDARTFAIAPGALTSKEALAKSGKLGAPRDPALADALSRLQGTHAVTFAFSAPAQSPLAGFLAQSGMEPQSGYGWLDLDATLRGELVARFATAEHAAATAKQTLSGPLAKLQATAHDRDVTFRLELDAIETSNLIDQVTRSE